MTITLRQMRYFIAAANTGRFSSAADEMNISQSAITNAVKALEDAVGTRLFNRKSNGVSLTYEGNLFLDRARNIVKLADEAVHIPRHIEEDKSGILNLAVTGKVSRYFTSRYLPDFFLKFPKIKINVIEEDLISVERYLMDGVVDLAVTAVSNIDRKDGLSCEVFARWKRSLWVSANHRFLRKTSVDLQEVSREPYVMMISESTGNSPRNIWKDSPYYPCVVLHTDSLEAVRSMVANNLGVTILSDLVYRPCSLEGRGIKTVPISEYIPTMDVSFYWASKYELNETSMTFVEFISRVAKAEQP